MFKLGAIRLAAVDVCSVAEVVQVASEQDLWAFCRLFESMRQKCQRLMIDTVRYAVHKCIGRYRCSFVSIGATLSLENGVCTRLA